MTLAGQKWLAVLQEFDPTRCSFFRRVELPVVVSCLTQANKTLCLLHRIAKSLENFQRFSGLFHRFLSGVQQPICITQAQGRLGNLVDILLLPPKLQRVSVEALALMP